MSVFGRVENVKNDNEKYERSGKKKSECAYLRWKRVRNFEENIENLKKKIIVQMGWKKMKAHFLKSTRLHWLCRDKWRWGRGIKLF